MTHPWIVVAAVISIGLLCVLFPVAADFYRRYRGARLLRCPETGREAQVGIDAPHVALTSAFGRPRLRVKSCSLWPEKEGCRQKCLTLPEVEGPGALRLQPR